MIQRGRIMQKNVQISLLGKNEIGREGLRKILSSESFEIRNSVTNVAMLVDHLDLSGQEDSTHVIIVDNSHDNDGLEACRTLVPMKGKSRLMLLAEHYSFDDVAEAFQIGVDAVIIKEISCEPLIESIRLVALGEKVFPSHLAADLANCLPTAGKDDWKASAASVGLSGREIEILEAIMVGMANKVIARQFDICEATVKVHVKAILRKLAVANRTQAATWAVKHGMGNVSQSPPNLANHISVEPATLFGQAA
jgi:two-component system, NarL family, nitrate/nitrite response regulator NarL